MTAPSSRRSTAGRCGWSSPSATPGRVRNGWEGWSGSNTTALVSGRKTATTTPPTRGKKNGTGSARPVAILNGRGAFGTLRGGTLRQPLEPDLGNASGGKMVEHAAPTDEFLRVETHG